MDITAKEIKRTWRDYTQSGGKWDWRINPILRLALPFRVAALVSTGARVFPQAVRYVEFRREQFHVDGADFARIIGRVPGKEVVVDIWPLRR